MKPEIYVSTDVETDGPIPGPHSMLSLGSAAFLADKTLVDTYSANLELLPGAEGHPRTMGWWRRQPEAWEACRVDTRPPEEVMPEYAQWLRGLAGKPVEDHRAHRFIDSDLYKVMEGAAYLLQLRRDPELSRASFVGAEPGTTGAAELSSGELGIWGSWAFGLRT